MDRTKSRITVFGGWGFRGRQIVRCLAADGAHVRVAVRHPERASFPTDVSSAAPRLPYKALLQLVLEQLGRKRLLIPVAILRLGAARGLDGAFAEASDIPQPDHTDEA